MDGTVTRNSFNVLVQPTSGVGVVAAGFVKMMPIVLRFQMRNKSDEGLSHITLYA